MSEIGYLYVLANSSMPGFSKVGKTTRNPTERAAELSGVTGLPTPFIVVYEQLFEDCSAAESFVHTFLAQSGYRVSDNREFFNAPVNVIVKAIAQAPGMMDHANSQPFEQEASDELLGSDPDELDNLQLQHEEPTPPWAASFDEAMNHYNGLDDCIQDYNEALRLFRQAATLGCLPAYGYIGDMYLRGEGMREDKKKALDFYKEGARKGSAFCYCAMGFLFTHENNSDNAEKCFSLYLKNIPNPFPDNQKLTESQLMKIVMRCMFILRDLLHDGKNISPALGNIISIHFTEMKTEAQMFANHKDTQKYPGAKEEYEHVVRYLSSIQTSTKA